MMAAYKKVKEGRKVVYLSPLRALASEKYAEFKELDRFGISCAIGTGDFDASGEVLGKFDLLVLTNEKFDSILRHGVSWLRSVGLFISDEVHLAGSGDRGPTLEMILTRVIHLGLDAQLLSLSATISNADEMAKWLKSELVSLDWRPVPLREGVYDYGRILFSPEGEVQLTKTDEGAALDVAIDSIKEGGQSLIFAGTRRRAVSLATKGSELTRTFLSEAEREQCREAGEADTRQRRGDRAIEAARRDSRERALLSITRGSRTSTGGSSRTTTGRGRSSCSRAHPHSVSLKGKRSLAIPGRWRYRALY